MDKTALLKILIFSIPENLVITSLACVLLGARLAFDKKIIIAVVLSIVFYYIRMITDSFIIYSVLYDIALIAFFRVYKVSDLFNSTIAVFVGSYTYLVIEFISLHMQQIVFRLDPLMLADNFVLSIVCFIPQLFIAFVLEMIIRRKKISILNVDR